ncbi:MAG: hypothetical protein ACK42L_06190 [Thermoanaerobaculum sp.]
MSEETRRVLLVAAALVLLVAAVLAFWRRHESLRPQLLHAAVVFWVEGEEWASDDLGPRQPQEPVWAGVLLQFRQGKGPVRFLCPFSKVRWQGQELHPEPLAGWPSAYGLLKAQWFTLEPAFFGWEGVNAGSAEKLAYSEFAAPEMGSELKALVTNEAHNDDFLTQPVAGNTLSGGVTRLKVKVGAYARPQDLLPWASVSSPGAKEVAAVPALWRLADVPEGVNPKVSLAFRCGVFSFAPGFWPEGGPGWPLSLSPRELVVRNLIMTPKAVAALAAVGDPWAEPWAPPRPLVAGNGLWLPEGRKPLRWREDVVPGDAVTWSGRWAVLWADDGNGTLDLADTVLLAWNQPPRLLTLGEVAAATRSVELRRVVRGAP